MPRLVTFGCSHTFGVGLPDIHPNNDSPSAMAWPSLLAKMLNREVQNEAVGGSGNAEIFDKIIRYKFLPDDMVIIMWSHFVRLEHFKINAVTYLGFREWKNTMRYDDPNLSYENAYKNYVIFHHCELFLKNKNIEAYCVPGFKPDWDTYPIPKFLRLENYLEIDKFFKVDRASDGQHFGVKSHKKLSEIIYNKIEK